MKPLYLYITPFFPSPTKWRGAYCYDQVKAILADGRYDVIVFVPGVEDYSYQGVQVCGFPTKALPSCLLDGWFDRRNERQLFARLSELQIDPSRIAVVHTHTIFTAHYAVALKKKNPSILSLCHYHCLDPMGIRLGRFHHLYPQKLWQFCHHRALVNQLDGHVAISKQALNQLATCPKRNPAIVYDDYIKTLRGLGRFQSPTVKASYVLHNGVDTEQFSAVGRSTNPKTFVLGCVSNFGDLKDHASLIRACAQILPQIPTLQLRLIGTGPTRSSCEALIQELGLSNHVIFEPECDHTQLPDFYRSLDLFVLPSYFEGFGCVFTEAWACGTPFITCEGQGMDDLIADEDRSKWLCKPRNAEDLAAKILAYYTHRYEQKLTGEIAIQPLVSKFLDWVDEMRVLLSTNCTNKHELF